MASRTKQKEEARARRLAEERARAEQAQRARRMRMLGGVVVAAVAIVAVIVAISVSGSSGHAPKPGSSASRADVTAVTNLLAGIPQSGTTLGQPNAPVTITEYGDLDCPVCDAFALPTTATTSDGTPGTGYFDQIVNQYVRTGKAKIVFRSLETATATANGSMWAQQQAAAYAAGLQNKAWDYIELFYYQQQPETSSYVTPAYLAAIAQEIPGLNMSSWQAHRQDPSLEAQVTSDGQAAANRGFSSTPTLDIQGPKGHAAPITVLPSSFGQISSEINQVS